MSKSENTTSTWKWFLEKVLVPLLVAIISVAGTYWFATREKTPSQASDLGVENIPQNIFVFAGNNNPDGGWGAFSLIYDDAYILNYRMEYSLPDDKYGYAGLVFQFPTGYNLSPYTAVKFTIAFKVPTDEIDLFVKDIGNNNNSIHIAGNGKSEMILSYEFANFPNINFGAVKEIGLIASTDFSKGDHEVRIKNVYFVK